MQLRVRCVGEGGNLGFTQRGRVEYAARGGRIDTDFIDNSAGVDTSDHEVNIKILLSNEVAAGRLSQRDRDAFLASMTDEVADLVLAHNYDQNLALANSVYQSASMAGVHEDSMERLTHSRLLNRELEALPSTDEMDIRRSKNRGLTSPELATLMAYTKIVLEDEILGSDLPDDPYLTDRLITYFPTAMRERYAAVMTAHRLHREIIATVVVNQFVDASGITCFHRLSSETGASSADIIRAQIAARTIFGADQHDKAIRDLDHRVDAQMQTILRMEVRTLVERATRWLINNHSLPLGISAAVEQMTSGVQQVQQALPTVLQGRDHDPWTDGCRATAALACWTIWLPSRRLCHRRPRRSRSSRPRNGRDVTRCSPRCISPWASGSVWIGCCRGSSNYLETIDGRRWLAQRSETIYAAHAQLTAEALNGEVGHGAKELVAAWERQTPSVHEAVKTLRSICAGRADLARMSVGLRIVRGLLSNPSG